jgi:hypothetical protein
VLNTYRRLKDVQRGRLGEYSDHELHVGMDARLHGSIIGCS